MCERSDGRENIQEKMKESMEKIKIRDKKNVRLEVERLRGRNGRGNRGGNQK